MSVPRRLLVATGVLMVTCFFLLAQYKNSFLSQSTTPKVIEEKPEKNMKTILYWTPIFGALDFNLGLGSKIFQNCIYKNCYTTYHKNALPHDEFDAIFFHGVEYKENTDESPVHTKAFSKAYNNFFNWTLTYRHDSDIVRTSGSIERATTNYSLPTVTEIQKKPKKIAWFVSNCATPSKREVLYNEIRKYVPVDVYGACGDYECPRSSEDECYDKLEKDYKFYLSFENSVCEDYVTEKLFNVLQKNVIPIVYGGADYSLIAPPHSVINVMDFKTVKELVDYINYLDSHPEEYLKYFEWKKNYISRRYKADLTLCTLCKQLNEPTKSIFYTNLDRWWNGNNNDKCSTDFIKRFL